MFRRALAALAGAGLLVAVLAAPAAAQDAADDGRTCNSGNAPAAERIAACTRVIDAGGLETRDLVRLLDSRGDLLAAEGDFAAAIADYTAILAADPANRNANADRGLSLMQLGRFEEALADLDAAVAINDRFAGNLYLRGLAHAAVNDVEAAIADFAGAVVLDPNYHLALIQRGRLLASERRFEEAAADLAAALDIQPYDARAFAGLGLAADLAGDTAEAVRNYRAAMLLDANLYAPPRRLPALAPEAEVTDSEPLQFVPPAEGLEIEFITAVRDTSAAPPAGPMEIGDRLFWRAGPATEPLPAEYDSSLWIFGTTEEGVTELRVTRLRNNSGPWDQPTTYDWGLMPGRAPVELGAGVAHVNRGVEAIWHLVPGESTTGDGRIMADCPEEPGPFAEARGCMPNVPSVRAGTFSWTATFAGWEYVLVPAGYRLAARVEFQLAGEVGFDDPEPFASTIVLWFDPAIGWWVKRETTEAGTVTTTEALVVTPPAEAEEAAPAE